MEYGQYLHNGSQSEQLAFTKLEEDGIFKIQDSVKSRTVFFNIIVCLNLKLYSLRVVVTALAESGSYGRRRAHVTLT